MSETMAGRAIRAHGSLRKTNLTRTANVGLLLITLTALVAGCGDRIETSVGRHPAKVPTTTSVTTRPTARSTTTPSTASTTPPKSSTTTATTTTVAPTTAPPLATPAQTIAPFVTAGTAVPWSPTSPRSLVGDSGDPKDWPAAQPHPPSLAGAQSMNMMKVLVTLLTYEDWVWSHPNPALVGNYMLAGSQPYDAEVQDLGKLRKRGLHMDPSPTEIDWMGIVKRPLHITIHGRSLLTGATVEVILNQKAGEYLDSSDRVIQRLSGAGRSAYFILLVQAADLRWKIQDVTPTSMPNSQ